MNRPAKTISSISLLLGLLTACSPFSPPAVSAPTASQAQIIGSRIDSYLSQLTKDDEFSGSVLVGLNGNVLLSKGYGFADVENGVPNTVQTVFLIGSVDKQITAMAILILHAAGKLRLEEKICAFISDCPSDWQQITIHHLLTHSSGIPDFPADISMHSDYEDAPLTPGEIITIYKEKPLLFPAGDKFSYSTPGYILLMTIIEKISDQSYARFLEQNIFDPIGMADSDYACRAGNLALGYTSYGIRSRLIEWPRAYSMCTTVEDFFAWDQSLYTEKLVDHELIDLMFTPHIHAAAFGDMDYGYGWSVGEWHGHQVAGHGGWIPGGGFRSFIQRYPEERAVIIVLSNQADVDVFAITSRIADIVFAG